MKRILTITILLLLLCSRVWAVEYYCDLSNPGTDSGSAGTFADPFVSIVECNNTSFSDGDDLYFMAGESAIITEYLDLDSWDGTSGDRVIIGAYDGDGDFDITGSARPILDGNNACLPVQSYIGLIDKNSGTGYVTIQDIELRRSNGCGIRVEYPDNIIVNRCKSYQTYRAGITLNYVDTGVISNNIVDYASYNRSPGAGLSVTAGWIAGSATNITISNNTVTNCYEGIGLYKEVENITVEYNEVYDNRSYQIYTTGGASNVIVRYNLIYSSSSDPTPTRAIVFGAEALWCDKYTYASDGCKAYGNALAGGSHGIVFNSSCPNDHHSNFKAYNNAIIDFDYNFFFTETSSGEVKNNISWALTGGTAHFSGSTSPAGVIFSHNFYNTDPGGNANDNAVIDAGGPGITTTSGWKTLTAGVPDGTGFEITSASPCKDTGTLLDPSYVQGLYTGTDFSTSPPTVVTASHIEHGTTDIGAWVYDTGGPPVGGECLLSVEGFGETGRSAGIGSDYYFFGTENTSGSTIVLCKIYVYGKWVGSVPTPVYFDIYARDGVNLTGAATPVCNTAGSNFPTGSPSWVEIEVSPTVNWDDGDCLVMSTHNFANPEYVVGYYGTDTETGDFGIPELWQDDLVRKESYAGDVAFKVYDYSAAAGSPAFDAIGIATVSGGIVTFYENPTAGSPATLDALESSTGFPGWFWAGRLTEQLGPYATPEPSEFRWDCGPESTDYQDDPYYGRLPDAGGTYYMLWTPNLLIGLRPPIGNGPQAYGTTADDWLIENDAVLEDGDGNSLVLTYAVVDIDGTGEINIGVADTFTIGSGGDFPLWSNGSTGFHDLSYDIDRDKFNVLAAFTDDVAISADNVRIRGTGGNVAITGTMTLTGDNTIIKCLTFSGGITDNGNDYVYQENCRGQLVD